MTVSKRGSEEPGDQIQDRLPANPEADASSRDQGRSLDQQANVAGGRWELPEDERDQPRGDTDDTTATATDGP